MKKLLTITLASILLLAVVGWLPACSGPGDDVPVDSTDYKRLIEVFTELEGEAFADEWAREHDPGSVILIEDTVYLSGVTEILKNGEPICVIPNSISSGLGQIMAYALRTGNCQTISAMQANISNLGFPSWFNMSAPARTAGGRGSNPYVTVQSSWTSTLINSVQFIAAKLLGGVKELAYQVGDNDTISPGDTLTINWTVNVGGTYASAQCNQMAKGISPEPGYGGTMYELFYGKFVNSGGFVSNPPKQYTGGDMDVNYLLIEWGYTHSGATQILTAFQVLNSNSDLVAQKSGLGIELTDGKKINGFHLVTFADVGG